MLCKSVLVFAICLLPCIGNAQSEQMSRTAQEEILEKKMENVATMDFVDTVFSDVIQAFDKKFDIKIAIHQSAIDTGLGSDDLATFQFDGVRLETALSMFLEKYDATYRIRDNQLILMTKDEAQNHLRLKVYDCRELCAKIKPITRKVHPAQAYQGGGFGGGGLGGGGGGGPGGVFNLKQDDPKGSAKPAKAVGEGGPVPQDTKPVLRQPATLQPPVAQGPAQDSTAGQSKNAEADKNTITISGATQLVELIENSVDPNGWENTEGLGTIREINGLLVVTQTDETHLEISELIKTLEKHLK